MFPDALLQIMNARGISQADLCRMSGVDTGSMSNYLNGKRSPTLSKAIKIADALGISLDDMVGRSEAGTAAQRELLVYFNQLNEEGQESAIRTVQGLNSVDVYKKSYPVRVGNEKSA